MVVNYPPMSSVDFGVPDFCFLLLSSFDMALHFPNASRSGEMHGVGQSEEGLPKVAELIDLYWDGEPKDRSSDQAASVPVPPRW